MGMTTVWRPRVRIEVRDVVGEVESKAEVTEEELLTKKGTKRKRAPRTKGPCEHGVKYRSKCKVCSKCAHGRTRYACKECGGAQYASTVVSDVDARSAVGHHSASTVVGALSARSAVGHQSASTVVGALTARSAVGLKYASTVVSDIGARTVAGVHTASTVVSAEDARSAGRTNDIGSKQTRHSYPSLIISWTSCPCSATCTCSPARSPSPHHSHRSPRPPSPAISAGNSSCSTPRSRRL